MKIKIIGAVLALLIVLACGFTVLGEENSPANDVASTPEATVDPVLSARLLNMLQHNRVYNEDFNDENTMIENSVVALFEKADEDGYVSRDVVNGFVYSMYGITAEGYVSDSGFAEKENCIFILPKGYDLYSHEIQTVEFDGDYLYVTSLLTIDAHDSLETELHCNTVFKVNKTSGFGYNIISSNYY